MFSRFAKIIVYITVFMLSAGFGTYFAIRLLIPGRNLVVVPDLKGKEVVYALEVLSDLGLNTKVKDIEFSPAVPKHHIIEQFPDPGTEMKRGRDVRLVISKGVRTVVFPNLVGMDMPLADIIIEENDLRQRNLTYAYSRGRAKGKILAQYPTAGTKGVRGDALDLLISSGQRPQWLRMPDLVGMELDDAIVAIEERQLAMGTISRIDDPAAAVGSIVDQSPSAGSPVLPGTAIDLTVNRLMDTGLDTKQREATLFRYQAPKGFLRQHVRVRISRPDMALNIFNDYVKPNETVWLMILRNAPTALFLYVDGELKTTRYYE